MTVAELIAQLQKLPQDSVVIVSTNDEFFHKLAGVDTHLVQYRDVETKENYGVCPHEMVEMDKDYEVHGSSLVVLNISDDDEINTTW
jgi:hypothetical protein